MSTGLVYPLECVERKGEFTRTFPCEELFKNISDFRKIPERDPDAVCKTQTYDKYNVRVTKFTCTKNIMSAELKVVTPVSGITGDTRNTKNTDNNKKIFTKVRLRGDALGFNVIDEHYEIPPFPGMSGIPDSV